MTESSVVVDNTSFNEVNLPYDRCEKRFLYGDSAYMEERYNDAAQLYTSSIHEMTAAVETASTRRDGVKKFLSLQFKCYVHRSMAYQQLEQYTLASADIGKAVQLYEERDFDALDQEKRLCYRQHAIVAYQLQKYSDAQTTFEKILREKMFDNTKYNEAFFQNYLRQCQLKLEQQPHQQHEQTLPSNNLVPIHTTSSSSSSSSSAAAAPSVATATTSNKNSGTTGTNANPFSMLMLLAPKYQYYQKDTQMIIEILEPNVSPSDLIVNYIGTQNLAVSLQKQGRFITVINGELYDAIVPDKCSISYKSDKVVIKLRKEHANYEWQTLLSTSNKNKSKKPSAPLPATTKVATSTEADTSTKQVSIPAVKSTTMETTTQGGTVPSKAKIPKPYASHRDWDAIEKDLEMTKETPVGDEAMNQLFQQIYADADEDTKRAMIKSYQTSGGTVLSTNWNEVAQKDYEKERTAPEGQEWKTWEGESLSK